MHPTVTSLTIDLPIPFHLTNAQPRWAGIKLNL
jgi:hypothetical protein